MSTSYLVSVKKKIERKEGDDNIVVITVSNMLTLTGKTILFQVRSNNDELIIEKTNSSGITRVGQVLTIALAPGDTKGKSGIYNWELQISTSTLPTTIGEGVFIIRKEYAK